MNKGQLVRNRIMQSGMRYQAVADHLGVHRITLAKWLNNPELSLDNIVKIGKIIRYDFSKDIPEIGTAPTPKSDSIREKSIDSMLHEAILNENTLLRRITELEAMVRRCTGRTTDLEKYILENGLALPPMPE